jgi:two-component system response regulator YesN
MLYRVLLVDDEPFVREGIKQLINWEECGFILCGEASNGEEALEMLESLSPHVIITDIKMPVLDGLELIRRVNEEMVKKVKFVILSGYNEFHFAQTAMRYNVKNYILKPIDEDELSQILRRIYKEITSEMRLEKEHALGIDAMVSRTIKKIIKGEGDQELYQQAMELLQIHRDEPIHYITIEQDYYKNTLYELEPMELEDRGYHIRQLLIDVIGERNARNLYEEEDFRYGIITNARILEPYHGSIQELVLKIREKINREAQLNVSIFVGERVRGLKALKKSYKSSLVAMNYRFYKGENSIIFYNEIQRIPFNYDLKEVLYFSVLVEAVENNKTKEIYTQVDTIFRKLVELFLAPEIIQVYLNNFALEIMKIITQMDGNVDELIEEFSVLNMDIDKITINELKEVLTRFCVKGAAYIKTLRSRQSIGTIAKVEDYIRQNFRDDITLKGIAEKFYMNPVYLGQLFKKTFGIYFNDYLHNLRVEEAKKLLRRTEMKVYEIAEDVGYRDTDYFVSRFVKVVNMTPSQYKKSITGS